MSEQWLLLASFWMNQVTTLFVLGCHTLAAMALWRAMGGWARALTFALAGLWIASFMRLTVQLRAYQQIKAFRMALVEELFFWSAVGLLFGLAIGWLLKHTFLAVAVVIGEQD